MPTLDWNLRVWNDTYLWPQDGDEWGEQAAFCGVPYSEWKTQLAKHFLFRHIKDTHTVLEIGPGHGRWSSLIAPYLSKGKLQIVDLSPNCIEFCKKKLQNCPNVEYHVNEGRTLRSIRSNSIDFVWSFDTFVHIEEPEVCTYISEWHRVMKHQTMGCIHHPGSPTEEQRQNGMRSTVTTQRFAQLLRKSGLVVINQTSSWGDRCNLSMSGDCITTFIKP